jgi:hypothetical protein
VKAQRRKVKRLPPWVGRGWYAYYLFLVASYRELAQGKANWLAPKERDEAIRMAYVVLRDMHALGPKVRPLP